MNNAHPAAATLNTNNATVQTNGTLLMRIARYTAAVSSRTARASDNGRRWVVLGYGETTRRREAEGLLDAMGIESKRLGRHSLTVDFTISR